MHCHLAIFHVISYLEEPNSVKHGHHDERPWWKVR